METHNNSNNGHPDGDLSATLLGQQQHHSQEGDIPSQSPNGGMHSLGNDSDEYNDDDKNNLDDAASEKKAGRRKINIEYIEDKSRRHITFSKRKAGIMKKAFELSTLTGTQVLLLVASETGHVYTFATPKLQPLITKPEGKNLIQACLNSPDVASLPQLNPPPQEDPALIRQQQQQQYLTTSPHLQQQQQQQQEVYDEAKKDNKSNYNSPVMHPIQGYPPPGVGYNMMQGMPYHPMMTQRTPYPYSSNSPQGYASPSPTQSSPPSSRSNGSMQGMPLQLQLQQQSIQQNSTSPSNSQSHSGGSPDNN
eukprot:TRINITY_DN619_c0_g1_i2.p1 TRINITY_DN619_c0_g1~~TRINITY_DN619_c0_g1_i2.p1  ORF type:complete len:307 (-),score=72.72 TRINITY_DN619_c0_g1_i2:310-1230(-)